MDIKLILHTIFTVCSSPPWRTIACVEVDEVITGRSISTGSASTFVNICNLLCKKQNIYVI